MGASRGLAWPQLIAFERSDSFRTTPSVPIAAGFVQELVVQLEGKQEPSHRRSSSFGDRPSIPPFRSYSGLQTTVPNQSPKPVAVLGNSTLLRVEVIRGLKARSTTRSESVVLPLEPKAGKVVLGIYLVRQFGSEDDGEAESDTVSRPALSSVLRAISPALDLENLPPLPNSPYTLSQPRRALTGTEEMSPLSTPVSISRPVTPLSPLTLAVDTRPDKLLRPGTPSTLFRRENGSGMSFNTAVWDLAQEAPDYPIGGKFAAPMDRPQGITAILGKEYLEASMSEVTPLLQRHSPLGTRSNLSDPWEGSSCKEHQSSLVAELSSSSEESLNAQQATELFGPATPPSGRSLQMFTAPDTPRKGVHIHSEHEYLSDVEPFDGPVENKLESTNHGTQVRDFAVVTKVTQTDQVEDCPDCEPNERNAGSADYERLSASPSGAASLSGSLNSDPQNIVFPASGKPAVSVPTFSGNPPLAGPGGLGVPGVPDLTTGLAIPADITGSLDAPATPAPRKRRKTLNKGKKAARKGQRGVRRCRHLILRKPVLAVVMGRQLAGPTSSALRMIAKGSSVDLTALKENKGS
ncbi:hypothetical protein PZA11_000780 [Diplocarpon coronariae]|uniref:Uncharacterized protein n=1 Tax=Diplocarpon coronariae TaxID=2795749 RepID=A0A218Z1Q8_9HELO|nr:hypothetical protein JHW43_006410 [Diplocarpon mali]OWP01987.1 hypothetical protein B2J93_4613 [Marssonina coronariae]